MPHICVEYSANLEARLDIYGLCAALKDAAAETGIFPPAGIRVRAYPCAHLVIADGDARHGFVDISVRLREGREMAAKKAAMAMIFKAAEEYTAEIMASSPFMLSLEMRDIDAELSLKASSIRDYLPEEMR